MSFMTNQIIRRNKSKNTHTHTHTHTHIYIYIYIYIYICIYIYKGYLINYEYFNNLNGDEDMAGTSIMAGICTSPYLSPYPIEKVGDSPYPYAVNVGIPRQNGDEFGQYSRGRVCNIPGAPLLGPQRLSGYYSPMHPNPSPFSVHSYWVGCCQWESNPQPDL